MQRMFNLNKWALLREEQALAFSNPRARNVRLEVNAPVKTALHVVTADGEVQFLALVEGRDTLEFGVSGKFSLTVEGADVWVYTADGDDISAKVVEPKIFTKIVERRRRNPELEQIAALMQRNMERRLEQQSAELEQLFERRAAALAANSVGAGAAGNASAQPAPSGSGEAPPAGAPSDDGGAKEAGGASEAAG